MNAKNNEYHAPIVFHPGETLAEKLNELQMGVKEFAVRTNKPEKTIIAILKGKSSITPEMAVKFENVLKIPAHFWLNLQRNYDEFVARQKERESLKKSFEWVKKFPIAEMIKKGWISPQKTVEEKTKALLAFFGMSSPEAWENYFLNQKLKIDFRISLVHTKDPYAISAWLRKGELQAEELPSNTYDEEKFEASLPKIKSIMARHPRDFFQQLQSICLKAGVKVVVTPCIKKAPVNGCTRWLNDNPLIQLSGRYKRNDIFWFTFFHEAGHILLHGKKDIFLENIDYSDKDLSKEKEADNFAIKWTLSKEEEEEILKRLETKNFRFIEDDILDFAKKFNTHPAIIIGRLQHRKKIPHSIGKEFFISVQFEETTTI